MILVKRWFVVAAMLIAAAFAGTPAEAKGRVALVIGNNAYPNLPSNQQLVNAISDARATRDILKGLGFEVLYGENLDRRGMVDRLFELTSRLSADDTAFFFFAGHGVSFSGANYLLPVDIPAPRASGRAEEGRLADQAIAETQIIERVTASGAAVTVLVLDACRDNPLQSSDRRSIGSTRGLGQGNPARGVFSIYSAGHGQAALDRLGSDDRNPNSVFTRVFLEKLKTPGLSLQTVALQTRSAVVDLTRKLGHDQFPAYYDQLIGGEVYLAGLPSAASSQGAPAQAAPQARPDPDAAARGDYALAERTNTRAAWDAFLQRYPAGYYAELARSQRDKLTAQEARGTQQASHGAAPTLPAQPQRFGRSINIVPVIGGTDDIARRAASYLDAATRALGFTISSDASHTVRGYLVAAIDQDRVKLSYIWDVTDKGEKRVERITGIEVVAYAGGKDPWASVTPQAIQQIATKAASSLNAWADRGAR
jgi:uncharacterized caspase-like protein